MKKSKVLFLALSFVIACSVTSFANVNPNAHSAEIRNEIKTLIKDIDVSKMDNKEMTVKLQFIVNSSNEIVVVNVSDNEFESHLKNRLNYRKLKSKDTVKNKIYSLDIKFKKA